MHEAISQSGAPWCKVRARRILGFDFGMKRIGVAFGEEATGIATPLQIVKCVNTRPDWDRISDLVREWCPELLVVGLPINADGSEHEVTRAAQKFSRQLGGRYGIAVEMFDERLSSVEAESRIRAATGQKRRKEKPGIDAMAACVILEDWLRARAPARIARQASE